MWINYGVPLVWIVYPYARTVDEYQSDGLVLTLSEDDTLNGGVILPRFICSMENIFDL